MDIDFPDVSDSGSDCRDRIGFMSDLDITPPFRIAVAGQNKEGCGVCSCLCFLFLPTMYTLERYQEYAQSVTDALEAMQEPGGNPITLRMVRTYAVSNLRIVLMGGGIG